MSDHSTPALAQRLGVSMQRQRQRMGYTQADLAEKSDLSLKYIGQVERGEANVTVESLERIAVVLGWDPWTLFSIQTPPISQAVHGLLLAEVGTVQERLATTVAWLQALDPALRSPSPTAPDASGDRPVVARPRRHGRPRKERDDGALP